MGESYIGNNNGVSKKVSKIYIGDPSGVSRRVIKGYIGDSNGIARLFYSDDFDDPNVIIALGHYEDRVKKECNSVGLNMIQEYDRMTNYDMGVVAVWKDEFRGYTIGYPKYLVHTDNGYNPVNSQYTRYQYYHDRKATSYHDMVAVVGEKGYFHHTRGYSFDYGSDEDYEDPYGDIEEESVIPKVNYQAIEFLSDYCLYVVGDYGTILRLDGGWYTDNDNTSYRETITECESPYRNNTDVIYTGVVTNYSNQVMIVGYVKSTGQDVVVRLENGAFVAHNPGTYHRLTDVAYGDGKYVAVGNNTIAISTDYGLTWKYKSVIGDIKRVVYNDIYFVSCGYNGFVQVSKNGYTWKDLSNPEINTNFNDVALRRIN